MAYAKRSVAIATLIALALPAAALADDVDRDEARLAIVAAKAKIETNDRAGVNGPAADAQIRARDALEEAQVQLARKHEGRAIAAAKRADSLAELALATAQARQADAQRDAIATDRPQ